MEFAAEIKRNGAKIFDESGRKEIGAILSGLDKAIKKEIESTGK
jgi:hypothetical protein